MVNAKIDYENLGKEFDELTQKIAEQGKRLALIRTANRSLRKDTAATLEFEQKKLILSAESEKYTADSVVVNSEMEIIQQHYGKLKQLQDEILKRRQNYDELRLKYATGENDLWQEANKMSIVQHYEKISKAKRARYSTTSDVSQTKDGQRLRCFC